MSIERADYDDEPDAQPNWNERRNLPAVRGSAGMVPLGSGALVKRGGFYSLKSAPRWGGASLDPIFPECPRCQKVHPFEFINPFFSRLLSLSAGREIIAYGQFLTCDSCLEAIEGETAAGREDARNAMLTAAGFSTVNRVWNFDTYPNQGSPFLRRAKQYVSRPVHDIVIYGAPGVGKTGLAVAILKALWTDNHGVRIIRASELILSLRGTDAAHTQAIMRALVEVEFLLLDDLSALKRTEFFEDVMNVLIDVRQQDGRSTIITANVRIAAKDDPAAVLSEFFGYVAYDRLVERGEFWELRGTSGRQAYRERGQKRDRWSPSGDD
jgi:DNA replication protein DnaC